MIIVKVTIQNELRRMGSNGFYEIATDKQTYGQIDRHKDIKTD